VSVCLDRIAEGEPQLQAWAHLDPFYALAQARARDAELQSGRGVGPLHGVPIGVKDIFDTADFATENGSPIFHRAAPGEGCGVRRWLAGSRCRHPRQDGDDGAGAADAIAHVQPAQEHALARRLLRRLGGSGRGRHGARGRRQPDGRFCDPAGVVPRAGVLMQSHTLDTVGVLGRSVEDMALLTDCMAAFEPDDPVSYDGSWGSLLETAQQDPPAAPLFAFVRTPAWGDADLVLHAAFSELLESLGDRAVEVHIPSLADVIAAQRLIQLAENAHYYGPLLRTSPDLLSQGLKDRLEAGLKVDVQDYIRALMACEGAYRVVAGVLDDYRAILTPAAAGPAPHGFGSTGNPVFNGLWTYLGMPAVTLPLLEADGLPIGVQLVGARRDDGQLLRTARWLVSALESAD
jgi:Asp-tRNA(Asn)/Glu-tRNA(Gln) amidotransferase A subunit family amidase